MSKPTREITIAGYLFPVTQPYEAGQTINEAEAKALNQVRAENIRNNQATAIKKAKDDEGNLSDEAYAELKKAVAEYDAGYEFSLASVGGGRSTLTPVEKEARKIARTLITDALKAADRKVGDVDKEKLSAAIIQRSEQDDVVKLAKKRVNEQAKIAEEALTGLDL